MNEALHSFKILVQSLKYLLKLWINKYWLYESGAWNKHIFHKAHKTYYNIHLFTVITALGNNIPGHHWTSSKGMHFSLIQKQSIPMAKPFDINIL